MSISIRSGWPATCRRSTESAQQGQTAVEFVFVLLILIAGMAGLYQVLHFERDVFNRLLYVRQQTMREAHYDQFNTTKTFFSGNTMEFRRFGELLNSPVPLQVIDPNIRWNARVLRARKGTRYYDVYDTALMHEWYLIGGTMFVTDLREDGLRWRRAINPGLRALYPDYLDQSDP